MSDLLWKWPPNSRKAHVFSEDGRSLCRSWLYTGNVVPVKNQRDSDKPGPDDCVICFRKKKRAEVER